MMKDIFKRVSKETLAEQKRIQELQAIPIREAYSRDEAARKLCISLRKLDYLIAEKRIKAGKCGSRVLIPATEIESYLNSILEGVA
jgi:excisionase family DNA binding protein